jgi:GNAT superfamily N-acetyltransferase
VTDWHLRERRGDDLPELVAMADMVRDRSRWPPHRPGDTTAFVAGTALLEALVAVTDDGNPVGHVALHDTAAPAVMELAASTLELAPADLAVVARLFVDPDLPGLGLGRSLLNAAAETARQLGRVPILDVWTELDDAINLYARTGWKHLGEVTFTFSAPCGPECLHEGNSIRSRVFTAPM